jgi:2-polyprenyl-3-methyl-5-hydroxy-6-metoxy-1,4-benzoquinol methylase
MTHNYTFDQERLIWVRPESSSLSYSDGDKSEDYLLTVLKNAHDLSVLSPELRSAIRDWPSEYHLSPVRHNLLRPFQIKNSDNILELGCGCGAISRYLGETGATVVAVEGSQRRAQIAAQRCRDLSNVKICCDNIADFKSDEKFDYVTLIGVLEYAPMFIDSNDPIRTCLEHTLSFLKKDGILILAIENQLGLKYFNGCGEDHTGMSYIGIHDLYNANTPVTFGKQELESRLRSAGFEGITFFYPFPDYKLSTLILADEGINHPGFRTADLLYRTVSRDYSGVTRRVFHENMAWRPIIRNGLLPVLANSFLVIANQSSSSKTQHDWLARLYTTERLYQFATETVFKSEDGAIIVAKHSLFSKSSQVSVVNDLHLIHRTSPRAPYVLGRLYASELHHILARNGDINDLANWAKPWLERLLSESNQAHDEKILPGEWLDAIPSNFVRDESGNLVLIDVEWQITKPLSMKWVVIRGFVYTLINCPGSSSLLNLSFKEVINRVIALLGYPTLTDTDFKMAATLEDTLQKIVNDHPSIIGFAEQIEMQINSCGLPLTFSEENSNLYLDNSRLCREIDRIKSTFSWRITKPLRFLSFLFHGTTKSCRMEHKQTGKNT